MERRLSEDPARHSAATHGGLDCEHHLLNSRALHRYPEPLMPRLFGRMALSQVCVCALLGGFASAVLALEPTAPDDAGIALDQKVQAFKDEAIQFNRDALMAEEASLYPPQTRVSVYVSNSQRNLLLEKISLTLDDRQPVVYTYGEIDSRALLVENALQRLVLTNMDRGQHRVRVSYNGNYVEGDDEPEPASGAFEAVFEKGLDAAEIELQLVRGKSRTEPAMKLKTWRAAEE
jgi:hypothetical protein